MSPILLFWEKIALYNLHIFLKKIRILRSVVVLILSVENSRRAKWLLSRPFTDKIIFTGTHLFLNFQRVVTARERKNLLYFFPRLFYTYFLSSTSQQNTIIKNNITLGCHVNRDIFCVSLWLYVSVIVILWEGAVKVIIF